MVFGVIMNLEEIKKYLDKHYFITFKYKEIYYSLQKRKRIFPVYSLIDTDNAPQCRKSLKDLFTQVCLFDGTYLYEIEKYIKIPDWSDTSWLSYEAIRHAVIIYNNEVNFLYKEKSYWIAHLHNGIAHLSDNLGNTQYFNSNRDLFKFARIDKRSLKEIWGEVIVYI